LTVTDTGTGMTEETRKRLFEPFFTTKEVGKGTGLGLSTVFGIVSQNGGAIRVTSAFGEGTELKIFLPRVARQGQVQPSLPPVPLGSAIAHVVLVDGDDGVRQITARMLRDEGHTVTESSNLDNALEVLALSDPRVDVVLTDIGLAGANFPAELVRGDIRILLMTGGGPIVMRSEQLPEDAMLLAKPFSRLQLLRKVQDVLQGGEGASDAAKR
jgi:two-component system cell cycle sensor histidine kinase/response regulator CckA